MIDYGWLVSFSSFGITHELFFRGLMPILSPHIVSRGGELRERLTKVGLSWHQLISRWSLSITYHHFPLKKGTHSLILFLIMQTFVHVSTIHVPFKIIVWVLLDAHLQLSLYAGIYYYPSLHYFAMTLQYTLAIKYLFIKYSLI